MAAICSANDCGVSNVWVDMLEANADCGVTLFKMNHFKAAKSSLKKGDYRLLEALKEAQIAVGQHYTKLLDKVLS